MILTVILTLRESRTWKKALVLLEPVHEGLNLSFVYASKGKHCIKSFVQEQWSQERMMLTKFGTCCEIMTWRGNRGAMSALHQCKKDSIKFGEMRDMCQWLARPVQK